MKNLILIFIIWPQFLLAQEFTVLNKIEMEVAGTSTLHDWEMVSNDGKGDAAISIVDGDLEGIIRLNFSIETESLKSGKKAMDKICYESMKTEQHERILFKLVKIKTIQKKGDLYDIDAIGQLEIAGKSNNIDLVVNAKISNQSIQFKGSYLMRMTDYTIDPPTALFGTVKTGNDLKISFSVTYQRNQ